LPSVLERLGGVGSAIKAAPLGPSPLVGEAAVVLAIVTYMAKRSSPCFKSANWDRSSMCNRGSGSFALVGIEGASSALVEGQTPRLTRSWRT
jgi:hypothetical protein